MGRSAVEACATLLRGGLDAYAAAEGASALRERTAARNSLRRLLPEHRVAVPLPRPNCGTAVEGRRSHRPVRHYPQSV